MKKLITLSLVILLVLSLTACGSKNILHCDGCGKEVSADAKMNEDWIVYCSDCEPEFDWE